MMLIKVQGYADAQAIFDVLNGTGVQWRERGGGWHELRTTDETCEEYIRKCFPNARITFKVLGGS
jgi:hypothetical protein